MILEANGLTNLVACYPTCSGRERATCTKYARVFVNLHQPAQGWRVWFASTPPTLQPIIEISSPTHQASPLPSGHHTVFVLRFFGCNFLSLFCRWRRVGPFADIGGAILDATIVVVTIAVVSQQVTQLSVSTTNICDTPGIAHGHDFDTGREEICRDR
jgi:hypothetical protein